MIKSHPYIHPTENLGKQFGLFVDTILLFLLIITINAGIFFPINPHWPIPVLLAIPFMRFLIQREIFHQVVSIAFRPWVLSVIGLFLIYRLMTGDLEALAYLFSSLLFLFVLVIYTSIHGRNLERIAWLLVFAAVFSCIFFLLRTQEVPIAEKVYDSLWGLLRSPVPTGFTGTLFQFGFQIAILTPLSIGLIISSRKKAKLILALFVFVLSLACLFTAGQRGPALGVGLSIILIFLPNLSIKKSLILLLLTSVGVYVYFMVSKDSSIYLISKSQTLGDYEWRLALQMQAFDALLRYPQGLILANVSWNKLASNLLLSQEITAHNSYLVIAMNMGWLFGIWILTTLVNSFCVFILDLKNAIKSGQLSKSQIHLGLIGGFFAVAVSALFHNPSLFTLDGPTWIVYCILWLCHDKKAW